MKYWCCCCGNRQVGKPWPRHATLHRQIADRLKGRFFRRAVPLTFQLKLGAVTERATKRELAPPYLGYKHAAQSHSGAEADAEAHGDNFVVGAEVDGHKSQPDDAGGVHGEGDVLRLVEISRDIAGLKERESETQRIGGGSCLK